MTSLARLWLFLLALAVTGCGFHLRGSVELPPALAAMTVQDANPATDIAPELRSALKSAGTQVSDSAPMLLQLKAERYGKRVLSVDSSGRAQEYGLSYTVGFLLKGKATEGEGETVWLAEESVTQTRDLRFDASAVLGSGSEEVQLKAEMRRDAVSQILRRLQKVSPPVIKVEGK